MRIGINLLYLLPGIVGGTETYAAGLLAGLVKVAQEHDIVVIVNREAAKWPLPAAPNITRVVSPVPASSRVLRYFYEQIRLPKLLHDLQVDIVHSLGYVGPVHLRCASVLTIPDPNYVDIAYTMPLHRRLPLRMISTWAAKNADEIITISNFSKQRLCQTLNLPANKITVTHLAPRVEMNTTQTMNWEKLRVQYRIREPYIVAFGGGAVHKNISSLLQAIALLDENLPHQLVLIGHIPPDVDMAMISVPQSKENRIIATGYIPGEHIPALLSHADLFVLPSLYEGFGLPVLEAQQAGVAVACSTAGSLPEIAGEGAVLFNPNSLDDIVHKIAACLSNLDLRSHLCHQGRANLSRFSWEKTAAETLSVYKKAMFRHSNPISSTAIL